MTRGRRSGRLLEAERRMRMKSKQHKDMKLGKNKEKSGKSSERTVQERKLAMDKAEDASFEDAHIIGKRTEIKK